MNEYVINIIEIKKQSSRNVLSYIFAQIRSRTFHFVTKEK